MENYLIQSIYVINIIFLTSAIFHVVCKRYSCNKQKAVGIIQLPQFQQLSNPKIKKKETTKQH